VTCGAELDPELWHCLGCARQAVQGRHDSLAELWRLAAVGAGCHAAREQLAPELAGPDADAAQRADVRVEWADGSAPAFYDVVVRTTPHRRGPAYVVDPCGVLVVQAEHDKLRTWGLDALVQPGCRFVPLAVETAGRWGPAAVAELLALARGYEAAGAPADGEAAGPALRSAFLRRWRQRLSVGLQRGSARCLLLGLGAAAAWGLDHGRYH